MCRVHNESFDDAAEATNKYVQGAEIPRKGLPTIAKKGKDLAGESIIRRTKWNLADI